MSIIAHLRQVSVKQLKHFDMDPAAAYSLILGDSLSSARNTSQELQGWKTRNALILLKVIKGEVGKLEPPRQTRIREDASRIRKYCTEQAIASIRLTSEASQKRARPLT